MQGKLRIDAKEAKDTPGPVADAMQEFHGYTYQTGFEHLAVENAKLKAENEQLR